MSSISTDGVEVSDGEARLFGSWFSSGPDRSEDAVWFLYGIGNTGTKTDENSTSAQQSGSYSIVVATNFDRNYLFKARGWLSFGFSNGSVQSFKSSAQVATANAPVISAITKNSATVDCTFNAKVVESTFVGGLYYRQFGNTTWIHFGDDVSSGTTISRGLSGLLSNTIYECIFFGDRTTNGSESWNSAITSFTTLADAPTLTTVAATVVTSTQATLNGTVNPNGLAVRVRFGWGTSDGGGTPGSWTNLTAYQAFSGSTTQAFSQDITGLTQSTGYFFRAFVEWPDPTFGNSSSDATLSFTSAADPLISAAAEDHVLIEWVDGHYGVESDFYFVLPSPAAISSDRFVTTAPGSLFVAGDIKVSKDGGSFSNVTNSVSQVAASNPLYKLVFTATEMQAELIMVQFVDQNGPVFRDFLLIIRTKQRLGQIILRADQIGSSAAAFVLQPSTGGYALDAQDGAGTNIGKIRGFLENMSLRANTCQAGGASTATLDASASATNSYYNGDTLMLVGGTGAGQSRIITGYDGTTKVSTVNAAWATNPDSTTRYVIVPGDRTLDLSIAELGAIPAAGAAAGLKLQFIFQRFAFKVTQTATVQTLYNASNVSLGTRSVSDDGTTQTIAKVS
jgi:hypothetical protein